MQTEMALVTSKGGGGEQKHPKQVSCSPAWVPPAAAQLFMLDSPKLGMLVRQIRIVLLLPLLLASVSVLAQAPRLTLSVDQGVPSGEMRLVQTDANTGLARGTEEGIAVSPDGRWLLASGDGGITVWEIDSARGMVTQRSDRMGAGLGGIGLAVSRDSSFVFTSDNASTSTISVWRLDADDGGLEEVAQYTGGETDAAGSTVTGLIATRGIVLSPDGRLLFVTSGGGSNDGTLSVWSIDPSSGTLTQTDVHVSAGASDAQSLNAIAGAAVTPDGRLLFAGSVRDRRLSLWRVNAEASAVSFVRTISDNIGLRRPRVVTLGPAGRFLFVSNSINSSDNVSDSLSVYEVNAAEEDLTLLDSYGGLGVTFGLAVTREVLALVSRSQSNVTLWQRNASGTLSFVSRHASPRAHGLAASPAGGLVFSSSNDRSEGISVWRVQGIPRVPAGQEVRVMVNAEPTLGSTLTVTVTVTVQARQGSRVSTATATLMPSNTQAEAVFSGRDLGQGEWIFSASVPADMADAVDASTARATLRIGGPLIRLENLSGVIPEGAADLNIRISTEGPPLLGDAEVTLRATQEGARSRTTVGFLREGQTTVTVTFRTLTAGDWVLSAESLILSTDANSELTVTVGPPLPRLTLSVDRGAPSGEIRLVQTDANTGLPSGTEEGVAVSPDGRWLLASGGSGITVWEIDSARGIVTQRSDRTGAGLGGRGLAVSRDSNFVFTSDGASNSTISVWRLNADDGGLEEVAKYKEGETDAAENPVRGLINTRGVVLSPDDRLLFVMSAGVRDNDGDPSRGALSVWDVNPSGTLVQTDVHVSVGASGTQGLNQLSGAAVTPDGRLLFAGSVIGSNSRLSIWRVNAEASTVSFVRTRQDGTRLRGPRVMTLGSAGRFLFLSIQIPSASETAHSLSVYEVNAAEEDLTLVESHGGLGPAAGLAVTREVLALAAFNRGNVALWQRNADGTLRFASRHPSPRAIGLAASPAGGLVFSSSDRASEGITVWRVQGIPRVPAGQEVRVMVDAEQALGSALTVMVQARQGSRVRTAMATLMSATTQTVTVFPGSDLGQGEWIFSASAVPADMADAVDVSAARATLRIGGPLVRLENLSGTIPGGADLNIRVSTEGPPVLGDAEVTLQAEQEGARSRTVMGLLREGQTEVTVTFAGRQSLTEGDWVLSASSILSTDANSMLAVTVGPPLPRLTLSVGQGVPSGEMRLVQTDANTDLPTGHNEGLEVSSDGRWLLASGGDGITVWEIDSVRGIVTQRSDRMGTGLGSRGLAVSRDSSFVFTSDSASNSTISVWRLDADDGRLEEVAQYTEGGTDAAENLVRGLAGVWGVVLSPDDRLLFVTSSRGADSGTLSVWSVNPSGTLVQTDVHVSAGASDTQGLNAIADAAVTPDGRLLFAGSFHSGSSSLDNSTLGIWRVNAEASTVSFVRTLSDRRMLRRPRVVTLGPDGRFLFVSSQVNNDGATDPLSVYEVKAAEEDLENVASYGEGVTENTIGLAATREVLAVAEFNRNGVALWQRNASGTLSFVSRHNSAGAIGLAASPAGGLVFNSSNRPAKGISVWQVQGIPRVPAGQEVRVIVDAEQALDSALTVMVQARQGSRVSMAAATLMPSDTQAEAVFSGRDLGQGEWIFSISGLTDTATLRIGNPLIRLLENLSGEIPERADLNIRVSTEGHPVLEDAPVTLRAMQAGAPPRTVMGLLRAGQTSVTVTFAGRQSLTEGNWDLSAESSILSTDANSALTVTVGPPLPRLTLSVNQGMPLGEMGLVQTDANTGLPTGHNEGLEVSPDGRWLLASGDGGIRVWEIDSVRGIVTQRSAHTGTGLGSRGLAVSRDSSLVFASDDASTSTISVWRLDADDGGLEEVAQYTGGGTDAAGNTVRGLASVWGVVLSPDDRLLFVTSSGESNNGALSVWSVNTSGTLVQTNVHVSAGASDTQGLNSIASAAVTPDGRLLFAGSFHSGNSLNNSTLGIWRVNAEASAVSFVRIISDRRRLHRPRVVTLGPDGRFLFVSSQVDADAETDPLSVYEVLAAAENVINRSSYGIGDIEGNPIGLAATREVLAVAELSQSSIALWQRNDNGTLRFASRHNSEIPIGLAASPAGGLVFSSSNRASEGISVWQVRGISRVPAGQEVRVMVNAEPALGSPLTVMVQARQGSRVSMAEATLMPSDAQAVATFSGSDLGPGEWIFKISGLTDTATLRIGNPLIRLENLSGVIPEEADLNIRVSTEGIPVLGDAEVTLLATQAGARTRTVMGLLREGQTSVTVTFADRESLTEGNWVLSAESSILPTDEDSVLAVTVGLPLPRLTLSVDRGVSSGEMLLVQTDANTGLASGTEEGLAVSPDGRWLLASGGGGITVWEIDSVRGIVTQRDAETGAGLGGRGLAVNRDSNLVFTSDGATISVWRLDADDGGLEEVAQYTGGGTDAAENTVTGLTSVSDVVLSPDDRLLFVTSGGGALSVWGVNPSGTLVQTDVHISAGASDTEGLNRIAGAAVTPDGRLLFAGSVHGFDSLDSSTLGIWRVNAEASAVSFVRTITSTQSLRRPRVVTLGPAGRFLFVSSQVGADAETDPLSVYEVNSAEGNLASVASYGEDDDGDEDILGDTVGLAATREVLAVAEFTQGSVALWQRNDGGTLRFVSRHASPRAIGLAASPAGGLVFSSSNLGSEGISVWQVLGIPRVPTGQAVQVMVNAEPAPASALTVMVQARQGSRVSTATTTLTPPDTQAVAVFSGSDLGQGEWIFSASVLTDTAGIVDLPTARATLRISGPLVRLSNLSGEIPEGADLNIRVSTEGMVPVAGNTEVTLQAAQAGARSRTAVGVLREGQASVTVAFVGRESLTAGNWVLSASSILSTDENSVLAVTVGPPLPRLTLSVDRGVSSGEMRLVQTDANTGLASGTVEGIAVSPDGRWLLASGGGGITVWEIDSVRGIVTQRDAETGAGLGGRDLAVNRDSSLVFTSDGATNSTISVWRLDADDGGLEEVAKYTEGGEDAARNIVRGLINAWGVVLSPDERLLFVTSGGVSNNGALSVWNVNPSGTLVQTDVHVSAGASDTQGLNSIAGAAVTPDGRLLFAGSFHSSLDNSTLGIWRVNAEASAVSFVRTITSTQSLRRPRFVTLGPDGRFLFVSNQTAGSGIDPLSVYTVNTEEGEVNLASLASYSEDVSGATIGLAATREVLAVAEFTQGSVALWQRNDDGSLRFVSRHASPSAIGLAASPAGGLVFSSSNRAAEGISVWQVLGIPRVPAGQAVRVMVDAAQALGSTLTLTVTVQARQGSLVRTEEATLMPADTQAVAVFSGSDLGRGEWIFSLSVPADMAGIVDVSAARTTLRIGGPLVRLENLSGTIPEGADLNIRVSTEGMVPVAGDTEVTLQAALQAAQEGARPRTAVGLLREGQTSVTVTFADRESLTAGDWVLSASSILSTDENSGLEVTVRPPLPRLTLSVGQGVPSGEMRLVQTDANTGLSTGNNEGLAVSPDGRWLLASGGGRITVWEIDSVRGIVTQRSAETGAGLGGNGLAVSRDSRLVFTSDGAPNSTISVWRLGADDGGLEEVAKYTERGLDAAGETIRGLIGTRAVVLSPDDRLLFVTSGGGNSLGVPQGGGALSVWGVNPSGTLVQTDVHVSAGASDMGGINGLNEIAGAAVTPDGRLLFAGTLHRPNDIALNLSRLSIWRVNAEASTVSFVRSFFDGLRLRRPRVVALDPDGRFLFASNQVNNNAFRDPLSVYEVNDAEENLTRVASYGEGVEGSTIGLAATREVLAVAEFDSSVTLWQRNDNGTLRFVSRHGSEGAIGLAASPAGGLVFSSKFSAPGSISVWQVQGIPRVPAGDDVQVMVNVAQAQGSTLTVTVQARQGSRVRMAEAALTGTQAVAVFSGSDLGQGEWIFSASVPADTADVSAARATLRIAAPLTRLSNLSGTIPEGADLNISVSTEGMVPVAGDAEVTLQAAQEGARSRTAVGLLQAGQAEVTVTFAGRQSLTAGDWVLSAESPLLSTDENSGLEVTVGPPLPRLTLSVVDRGVPSGEMRLVQTDANTGLPTGNNEGFAVSPDGRWLLASGGDGITIWEIDSVRGIVTQRSAETGAGLGGRALAVSRDSSLVFTSDSASNSTISVWRLGADDGGLEEVAKYTGGGLDAARNTVTGLTFIHAVVLSPDDRLLFVTSGGGALSVWEVNPSGTLVQTDVHVSAGGSDTEGLNAIAGAAVTPDGRLLFAGSFHGFGSLDSNTLGIWRVSTEVSAVSFVRTLSDRRMLRRPRVVTLGPAGRFLFVSSQVGNDAATDPLSVYRVDAAGENLEPVASYGEGISGDTIGLAATREVLAVAEFTQGNIALWQRNDDGTLRFVSRHASERAIGLAASPAGGLVFSGSNLGSEGISVWQVLGIPRVPARDDVRVTVTAEQALDSALTVTVQARQGSRVRTAMATLVSATTQTVTVFSGSDLGQGEWVFSASVPADTADVSAARATLRIAAPLTRLSNLSGVIPAGADLNIRVSTEGMVPVAGDTEVTLQAAQGGARPRTAVGLLREGQAEVTVTFAGRQSLTAGDWDLSAESPLLSTDENSGLAVTVGPPLPRLTLSVDQGVPSGEMRLVETDDAGLASGTEDLAVSPDGRWLLASSGDGITVWEIDSARGIITQTSSHTGAGLGGRGLAVSRDSSFVFTSDGASNSTISVWRLNADDGRLEEVAQYTGGGMDAAGNLVRGLLSTRAIVLNPDERLLFVTSGRGSNDGTLSVWNVNPSGTLVQTDVHISAGASDTEGLNQIAGVAVTPDGRLLFTGTVPSVLDNSTLGIWRVNAEASTVSFVRTLSDRRMLRRPRVVTLGPDGRFLFVSNQTAGAGIDPLSVYEVNAAEENLESVASYGEDTRSNNIGLAVTREVLAAAEFNRNHVSLWQRNDDGTLRFASSHRSPRSVYMAASPAGGLVFSGSNDGSEGDIRVWRVQGIPRVRAGQEVRVMVNTEQALGSALTVTVQARQGSRVSTATATLMPSDTQAAAVFSESALGRGEWIFSISGLTDRATLRIGNPLLELTSESPLVALSGMVTLMLRLTPAQSSAVMVTVAVVNENNMTIEQPVALSSTRQLTFIASELGAGSRRFTARGPEGVLEDSEAEVTVLVGTDVLGILSANPAEVIFPGDEVRLSAEVQIESSGSEAGISIILEVAVTPPDESMRSNVLIPVSAETSTGTLTFIPDAVPGGWDFKVIEGDGISESTTLTVVVAAVMPLDFNDPPDGVSADDLVLLLRYERLCVEGGSRPLLADCFAPGSEAALTAGLALGSSSYQLENLQSTQLPDVTGTGDSVQILIILQRALANIQDELLLPAAASSLPETTIAEAEQARDARLRIIQQILGRK